MEPEHLVTSLALSRQLKKLGVKQESYFYWIWRKPFKDYALGTDIYKETNYYATFTAAEIILPQDYQIWWNQNAWGPLHGEQHLPGFYSEKKWIFEGVDRNQEADARALMLIYLLEHKLIKL